MENIEKTVSLGRGLCLPFKSMLVVTSPDLFDSRFGTAGTYTVVKCANCSLKQLTPLPTQEQLKQLYESHYNFGGTYTSLRQRFLLSPLYRLRMAIDGDISFHNSKGTGRLLDVGCNEGRGLQFYRRNDWQAEGLELNKNAANVTRRKGFTVHTALIEDFAPSAPYDVVILSNVLEDSLNPSAMLRHVNRLLKPGGQVWISFPNGASLLRNLFGRYWINWHVPFHITQFTPMTLQEILSETGLGSVIVQHETPALWVAHSLIAAFFAQPGRLTRQLRNPLLIMASISLIRGILFPLLWIANRLGRGDCLVVMATKTSNPCAS